MTKIEKVVELLNAAYYIAPDGINELLNRKKLVTAMMAEHTKFQVGEREDGERGDGKYNLVGLSVMAVLNGVLEQFLEPGERIVMMVDGYNRCRGFAATNAEEYNLRVVRVKESIERENLCGIKCPEFGGTVLCQRQRYHKGPHAGGIDDHSGLVEWESNEPRPHHVESASKYCGSVSPEVVGWLRLMCQCEPGHRGPHYATDFSTLSTMEWPDKSNPDQQIKEPCGIVGVGVGVKYQCKLSLGHHGLHGNDGLAWNDSHSRCPTCSKVLLTKDAGTLTPEGRLCVACTEARLTALAAKSEQAPDEAVQAKPPSQDGSQTPGVGESHLSGETLHRVRDSATRGDQESAPGEPQGAA